MRTIDRVAVGSICIYAALEMEVAGSVGPGRRTVHLRPVLTLTVLAVPGVDLVPVLQKTEVKL